MFLHIYQLGYIVHEGHPRCSPMLNKCSLIDWSEAGVHISPYWEKEINKEAAGVFRIMDWPPQSPDPDYLDSKCRTNF